MRTIRVDYGRGTMSVGQRTFKTGDVITIDGSVGQVLAGRMPMIEPELSGEFGTLMGWANWSASSASASTATRPTMRVPR